MPAENIAAKPTKINKESARPMAQLLGFDSNPITQKECRPNRLRQLSQAVQTIVNNYRES